MAIAIGLLVYLQPSSSHIQRQVLCELDLLVFPLFVTIGGNWFPTGFHYSPLVFLLATLLHYWLNLYFSYWWQLVSKWFRLLVTLVSNWFIGWNSHYFCPNRCLGFLGILVGNLCLNRQMVSRPYWWLPAIIQGHLYWSISLLVFAISLLVA